MSCTKDWSLFRGHIFQRRSLLPQQTQGRMENEMYLERFAIGEVTLKVTSPIANLSKYNILYALVSVAAGSKLRLWNM